MAAQRLPLRGHFFVIRGALQVFGRRASSLAGIAGLDLFSRA
jgi:hypothetical protein